MMLGTIIMKKKKTRDRTTRTLMSTPLGPMAVALILELFPAIHRKSLK